MKYNTEKVDEAVLALLYLAIHEPSEYGARVWKGHDWAALARLHEQGYIGDPASKAKSVTMTAEGVAKSEALFKRLFGKK